MTLQLWVDFEQYLDMQLLLTQRSSLSTLFRAEGQGL